MKSLVTMAIATFIGLAIAPMLTVVSVLILGPVASFFLPGPSNTGMGFANLGTGMVFIFVIYFLSTLVAGFTAGFFISRWGLKADAKAWQGFLSGLLISLIPPLLLSVVTFSGTRADSMAIAMLTLPQGIAGLAGYYIAGLKYKKQTTE